MILKLIFKITFFSLESEIQIMFQNETTVRIKICLNENIIFTLHFEITIKVFLITFFPFLVGIILEFNLTYTMPAKTTNLTTNKKIKRKFCLI